MPNVDQNQPWNRSVVLGVADTTKEVMPAPGVGKALWIRRITVTVITSAAQSIDVESSDGAVELIKTPVSPVAGTQFFFGSNTGFKLPDNTALRTQPSAAGNVALVVAEGYTLGGF